MHLMPLIQSFCIPATDAGGVMLAMLLRRSLGRIAYGKLCDMIGPLQPRGASPRCFRRRRAGLHAVRSAARLPVFAVVYGFAYAGVMTSLLVAARALTPAHGRASSMGIILAFAWLGHAVGGYQGAAAFDLTGGYTAGFAVGATAGAVNLLLVAALLMLAKAPKPPAPVAA